LAAIEELVVRESLEQVAATLLHHWQDGRLKLLVTSRLLRLRHTHGPAFSGEYLPLGTQGACSEHLCAYARVAEESAVIVAVSRWAATLAGGQLQAPLGEAVWQDTAVALRPKIATGRYVDALTGRVHEIAARADGTLLQAGALFATLPCCVLARTGEIR